MACVINTWYRRSKLQQIAVPDNWINNICRILSVKQIRVKFLFINLLYNGQIIMNGSIIIFHIAQFAICVIGNFNRFVVVACCAERTTNISIFLFVSQSLKENTKRRKVREEKRTREYMIWYHRLYCLLFISTNQFSKWENHRLHEYSSIFLLFSWYSVVFRDKSSFRRKKNYRNGETIFVNIRGKEQWAHFIMKNRYVK